MVILHDNIHLVNKFSMNLGFELEKEVNYVAKQVRLSGKVSGWQNAGSMFGCLLRRHVISTRPVTF